MTRERARASHYQPLAHCGRWQATADRSHAHTCAASVRPSQVRPTRAPDARARALARSLACSRRKLARNRRPPAVCLECAPSSKRTSGRASERASEHSRADAGQATTVGGCVLRSAGCVALARAEEIRGGIGKETLDFNGEIFTQTLAHERPVAELLAKLTSSRRAIESCRPSQTLPAVAHTPRLRPTSALSNPTEFLNNDTRARRSAFWFLMKTRCKTRRTQDGGDTRTSAQLVAKQ